MSESSSSPGHDERGEPQAEPRGGEGSESLIRMLESLRVLLPGLQILFAFLLTVPYSARFARQGPVQEAGLYATLACATIAIVFLLAPLAAYRLRWPDTTRSDLERWNVLALVGIAFLGLTVTGSIFVLTQLIYPRVWAIVLAPGMTALLIAVLWYALPLGFRRRR